jgi:aminopeptidase-like protein
MHAFDHYHTNLDNISNVNYRNFTEAVNILNELIHSFDKYLVKPTPCFIGEPFLSRYNLHIDAFEGLDNHRKNQVLMDLIFYSGKDITIYEISTLLNLALSDVKDTYDKLVGKGLIRYESL